MWIGRFEGIGKSMRTTLNKNRSLRSRCSNVYDGGIGLGSISLSLVTLEIYNTCLT